VRYSVNVPDFGEFAAPEVFAEVARRAGEAGWDALLVWDHVAEQKDLRREIAGPWILLTAAALATRRIRLGTAITPVARRRPSKLAREVATLDRLAGGRMVLGAGLGAPVDDEYASSGGTAGTGVLAVRLDEGLCALDLLWSGEPVTCRGGPVTIDDVVFLPAPVQRPRVPVWAGAGRRTAWSQVREYRRAADVRCLDADRRGTAGIGHEYHVRDAAPFGVECPEGDVHCLIGIVGASESSQYSLRSLFTPCPQK
jgi:alkanesulfonate monooxygenase SsuD/methylene tetrahydromethanopterin reductase-like flavin-dependent oxidoreductase (luciferase family)